MSVANIWIHPIETGVLAYEKDEPIRLGLTFPIEYAPAISAMLNEFNTIRAGEGHFQPGRTVSLEKIICRISGEPWEPSCPQCLTPDMLEHEIDTLAGLDAFTIHLHSPMRLTRPEGLKTPGHRYCDEAFFKPQSPPAHIMHLISKVRIPTYAAASAPEDLAIADSALAWLDVSYGVELVKTIGGIIGKIRIIGRPTRETAGRLVIGQYAGIGKNPAFGFGFYTIPELDPVRRVLVLSRGMSLLERAMSPASLKRALNGLPNASPGEDMLSVEDIKKAGDNFIDNISKDVLTGAYRQGGSKQYRLQKEDGSFREIYILNVSDRLVHRAAADCLLPVVDRLSSNSSYAYQKGLNRKGSAAVLKTALAEGYTNGIKADISSFFESVRIDMLRGIIEGLLPFEPLAERVTAWLLDNRQAGIKGLPQGSPLSTVLCKLYLDKFNKDMESEGFRLTRYADDFAILFREQDHAGDTAQGVVNALSRLGLQMKAEKTVETMQGMPVNFLGFLVTPDPVAREDKGKKKSEDDEWPPVFKETWLTGRPVYLSTLCRGAFSNGPSLVIKSGDDVEEKIPWNTVSRMVIIGRSPFTGGVVYRAVTENVPVTFIDIMGRARGHLYPEYYEMPEIFSLQEKYRTDKEFCLSLTKEIISAKIHNSIVLIRRNGMDVQDMKEIGEGMKEAKDLNSLRGYEGAASKAYFAKFAHLVLPFEFKGRTYHPPDGPVNVLLSFGYTLLYSRIAVMLKDKGFNARLGFFHQGRGTHNALASDLMEELRHIVERVVLSLIHLKEINNDDFSMTRIKGVDTCRLEGEGFRKFVRKFEKTMATPASYHGGEKMSYNAYLDEMADNLKRSLKLRIPYKALRID